MSIIVSSSEDSNIEVSIRYLDRKHKGILIFDTKVDEDIWVESEKDKLSKKIMELKASGDDIPDALKEDPRDQVKKLKTWWRRADWGTQSKIIKDSQVTVNGEYSTDWSVYRMSQMTSLMVNWDLKTADGEVIPVNENILKRMDYNVALALINKYEDIVSPDEDELGDLN